MSKSKNAKPEVLTKNNINAAVDIKLTKSDLVDMVVSERRQELNNVLSDIRKKMDNNRKENAQAKEKHEKVLVAMTKKRYGKRIKAAEKFFGSEAKYKVETYYGKVNGVVATVECYKYCPGYDANNGYGSWNIYYGREDFREETMPTMVKIMSLEKEFNVLQECHNNTSHEINNLKEMGERTKAKWIRSILESSTEGQALLKGITNQVRKSKKLLNAKGK